MDRDHDHGPQAPASYPDHYRPHQTATPRGNFSTPEMNRNHQNYQEKDNLVHPSRESRFPRLEVRRYETRQYGAAAYAQVRDNSAQNPITPRNLHYSERLNRTQYSQRRDYDMRERRAESNKASFNPAQSPAVPRPIPTAGATALENLVDHTKIYLRSIKAKNIHSVVKTFWTLDIAPNKYPLVKELWSSLEFSLNLSVEKNLRGTITRKFMYLHCTPRSSNDRACLLFHILPLEEVYLKTHDGKPSSWVWLQLSSPGTPSGTESIQEENWRTILKKIHLMLLDATALPSTLQLELENQGDVRTIHSFFNGGSAAKSTAKSKESGAMKNAPVVDNDTNTTEELQQENPKLLPTQNGIVNGGGLFTGGASGVDLEAPRGPRQKNSVPKKKPTPKKNSFPRKISTPQNPRFTQNGTANGGASRVKTKFSDDSNIEKPVLPRQGKRKKQEPEVSETSVSDSERPRQTKKKKLDPVPKSEPQPEQERKIPVVSSDTESPKEARQRKKKPLPSEPERTEEPRRKKKKSLPSQPQRKAPVNNDSDSPEEPRRKKKMILPSGREREVAVDSDSDSDSDTPEEPIQRKKKKARPSKPRRKAPVDSDSDSPEEQRVKKKKKPQALIVLSDSDTPEEPKRKKKKSRPSEPEPAPPAPRGRKPKQDKARSMSKAPQLERTKSKRKNKQTPPPSPSRSPSPDPRTPPSNNTDLENLQKRLAEIAEAKNELFVEELELKAKMLRQRMHNNKLSGSEGKSLGHFTCSACGEYGHRKDSWKCEKHPGRQRVL
ncbi:hypothetical protein P167DRAFT_609634 [Morchella conica CCBAS932]|uniref:Uncharacterized protein n=1 Tax=Morchella conica CCBAS932 TaxID=1392247 RepID=A0A3N4KCF8_9PEZI|nr:hypothetical protein P167DRAFT_609634 [Morchella conica CCBAS932]